VPPPASPIHRRDPGLGARIAIVFGGALVLGFVIMVVSGFFSSDDAGTSANAQSVRPAAPGSPQAAREPGQHQIAVVVKPTALRATPGGRRIGRLETKTEFKSARVVPVIAVRGDRWLRVIVSDLPNGKRGWIDARDTQSGVVDYEMHVDVSSRRLTIIRGGRVVRRITTAVGEAGTPTPHGTFAITDKVPFTDAGSPYGCCALALSAHQPNTPSEWRGGDRIAIHATPKAESIGRPVTLGCMRVPARDARWLMSRIPLGTQVSIRA
jgi:lipoprotein-anchoring transpeptidase ErfK/SrfK